jgi:DNA-binding NarL/FixJ family response regulator
MPEHSPEEPPDAPRDIRVLLVDDHPQVRTTLAEILDDEDDLTVVGECADGSEVVAAAERLSPDIVCMDVSMREMDGLAAAEALRRARADVRIVVYTGGPTAGHEVAAAGANALVPKTARPDALLRCLRAVADGATGCPYCL